MARSASEKEMDYVYFAQIWSKVAEPDGQIRESNFYEGPYMDKRSAKRQANDAQRRINEARDANRIGPTSKPYYSGQVLLDKRACVVRTKINLEEVV